MTQSLARKCALKGDPLKTVAFLAENNGYERMFSVSALRFNALLCPKVHPKLAATLPRINDLDDQRVIARQTTPVILYVCAVIVRLERPQQNHRNSP